MEEKKKINQKQTILMIIGIMILVVSITGITYSFFNYTRTGAVNTLRLGDIEFNFTQGNSINLTNVFPVTITRDGNGLITNNDTDNIGTVEVVITGRNTYSEGVEYLVSSANSVTTITSNGKPVQVPISLDVQVGTNGNGTNDNLGTADANYFNNRDSYTTSHYKKLVGDTLVGDQMMVVGFIAPDATNTDNSVNGKITIKAYFDADKIAITDTPDENSTWQQGRTIMSTSEWNSLNSSGVSFQVKVEANEGIWVKGSLNDIMESENLGVDTEQGVDFSKTSEQDGLNNEGTKGVYLRAGTQNVAGSYPVYYYRGAVENNNVLFNNLCWKAVRTTETGGVKLIYNGNLAGNKAMLSQNDYGTPVSNNGFTFDTTDNSWNATMTTNIASSAPYEISFNVPAGDGYVLQITGVPTSVGGIGVSVYKGGSRVNDFGGGSGEPFAFTHTFGTLTSNSSDVVKVTYYVQGGNSTEENPSTIKVKMLHSDATLGMGCDNSGTASQITVDVNGTPQSNFAFNTNDNSPAYNGYMYGTVYAVDYYNWTNEARFGSSFTWDGTNYTLVDDSVTTPNATHHYSCNVTTEGGTCTQIRYVYYMLGSTKYYITLTGGDGIEEALVKMNTNTNDSNAKDKIETWYESQMNTVTGKLEDTIWCNDRSFGDNNNNGWIANGGSITTYLYYGARERSNSAQNTSTVKNQPSLACTNKNDAFTWKNSAGNGALDYPVGMITEDEMVLAGGLAGSTNGSFYLKSGETYWSLSPFRFDNYSAYEFYLNLNGFVNYHLVNDANGLRPAVSLKTGTPVVSGSGTVADPYVIG